MHCVCKLEPGLEALGQPLEKGEIVNEQASRQNVCEYRH